MKTYTVRFYGRTKGAIGICYPITEKVKAESPEQAFLKLYDKYENVHLPKIKEVKP